MEIQKSLKVRVRECTFYRSDYIWDYSETDYILKKIKENQEKFENLIEGLKQSGILSYEEPIKENFKIFKNGIGGLDIEETTYSCASNDKKTLKKLITTYDLDIVTSGNDIILTYN